MALFQPDGGVWQQQRHNPEYEHARVGSGSSTSSGTRTATDGAKTSRYYLFPLFAVGPQRSGRRRHLSRCAVQRARDLGRGQGVRLEGVDGGSGRCDAPPLRCVPIDSWHLAACCALSQLTGSCLTLGRSLRSRKPCLGGVSMWVGSESERSDPCACPCLRAARTDRLPSVARALNSALASGWSRGRVSCDSTVEYLTVVASPPSVVCVGRKDYLNWET